MKLVFDVESNGLHGEGFAVGWVVVDDSGKEIESGFESCDVENLDPWVAENVIPRLPKPTKANVQEVRNAFWEIWQRYKQKGASIWADCGWPVEHNFLSACVADDSDNRAWNGPYPLHEIATIFAAAGVDPTEKQDRLPDETAHHPTGDARQSARYLVKALTKLRGQ